MVHLILSSTKGNQGQRYFPYAGYLGLTPIRVEGIVRTKLDADQKPLQAKSITISIRCYESRIGRAGTSGTNLLVDYTQVLWQKQPTTPYEPISNLEFPFRIVLPPRVAGFSTAVFVDYRCMWRVEAVLSHVPITGVGSRQIRHFELPLVRYDVPPPLPPLLPSIANAPYPSSSSSSSATPFFLHETCKPRAPRIRYTVHAPRTPIGPHDQVAIPIHIQSLDNLSVRSASIIVERRIILQDGTTSSSSSAPIPIPVPSSSQPNSASSHSRSYPNSSSPTAASSATSADASAYDYPSQKKRPSTSPFPSQHSSSSSSFFGLGGSSSSNSSSKNSSSRPASSSGKSRPSSSGREKSGGFAPFGFLSSSSSSSPSNNHHNTAAPIPNDSQLSFGSGATITQSAVSLMNDTTPLLGSSSQPSTPASAPATSSASPKVLVHNIAFAESSGAFARAPVPTSTSDPPIPGGTYFAKTLTLAWPSAKGQSRWAVGSTIATSEIVSVRFFLRTKIVVTYTPGGEDGGSGGGSVTESMELKEEEVLVVGAGEAERRAALEALGGMFGGSAAAAASASASAGLEAGEASVDLDAAARRSKSKSPRRVADRERERERERARDRGEREWESLPSTLDLPSSSAGGPAGGSIISSSGSSGRTVRPSKSSNAMRRPHTSAGPRDRPPEGYERVREAKRQIASGGSVPLSAGSTSGSGSGSGTESGGQISASSSSSSSDAHGGSAYSGMPPPSAYHTSTSTSGKRRSESSGTKENDSSSSSSKRSKDSKERRPDTSSGLIGSGRGAAGFFSTVHNNTPLSSTSPSANSSFMYPGGGRSGGGRSARPNTSAGLSSNGDKEKGKSGILGSFVLGGLGALAGSGTTVTQAAAGEYCGTLSTGSTASDSSAATTSSSGRSADYSNSNSSASGRSQRQYVQQQKRPGTGASVASGSSGNASATTPTGGPRGRAAGSPTLGVQLEWEEELARIEARSRRSSDLLGFNSGVKARGVSRSPTAVPVPVPMPMPVDLGLSMVHAGHVADM